MPGDERGIRGRGFRAADGSRYAKCARRDALEQERDRTAWLSARGIGCPAVLDWRAEADRACLVISAVPGVPADTVTAAALQRAWPSIMAAVRGLHALPAQECPFSRDLAGMFTIAEDVVARGKVNPDFLPVAQQRTPPAELLARLAGQRDLRLGEETADTVVCHGDLCLPNIILDPDTMKFAGFIDLGRLGLADRHADLALLLTNARETWAGADAGDYGTALDTARLRFYLHLDPLTWD